jgi:hypothetical protein
MSDIQILNKNAIDQECLLLNRIGELPEEIKRLIAEFSRG